MKLGWLAVALFALPMITSPAVAEVKMCSEVTDTGAIPVGPLYVASDGSLWQENNREAGLQTEDCTNERGNDRVADIQVAALP